MTSGVKRDLDEIEALKAKIIEYLMETPGGTFAGACAKYKIGYSTGFTWQADDPAWQARVAAARRMSTEIGGDFAEGKLMACVQNGEFAAIKYYLGTIHKKRGYVERQEQTGAEGGPVETKAQVTHSADLADKSLDELTRLFTERLKP